jgi:RimJ/RimL family protein N-acetyltransferase
MMSQNKIQLFSVSIVDVKKFIKEGELILGKNKVNRELLPDIVANDAISRYEKGQDWFWCSPRFFQNIADGTFVGSACFKNCPYDGLVEIGYGVLESYSGKGFATAGIAAIINEAFKRTEVKGITSETSVDNVASQRVLEKNGFVKTGTREDAEDGSLIVWKRLK